MKLFLWIEEKEAGPYELAQIREMIGAGTISFATLGLPENRNGEWRSLDNFPEVVEEVVESSAPSTTAEPQGKQPLFTWGRAVAAIVILSALVWVAVGIHQRQKVWQDFHPSHDALRVIASNEINEDLSNNIVGLSRIVEVRVRYTDSTWRGKATYEFVNKVGGIERRGRLYVFNTLTNSDGSIMDLMANEDPDQAQLETMAADGNQGAIDALKKLNANVP